MSLTSSEQASVVVFLGMGYEGVCEETEPAIVCVCVGCLVDVLQCHGKGSCLEGCHETSHGARLKEPSRE